MKLYYAPGTCALASHIALEEAGAAYAAERLDFKNSQQTTPQYLAINPKGRVPALVTDKGALTETPAILARLQLGLEALYRVETRLSIDAFVIDGVAAAAGAVVAAPGPALNPSSHDSPKRASARRFRFGCESFWGCSRTAVRSTASV